MDVSAAGIEALATTMSQTRTAEAMSTTMLKKAIDLDAQGAMQLIAAATQSAPTTNNPPHLGNNVDTFA